MQFGWRGTSTLTKTAVDKWKSDEAAAQFGLFSERPFCPMCRDITSANDDVPVCALCLCSCLVLQLKKKKASEDFYDFTAWMKDLERICITIFITN